MKKINFSTGLMTGLICLTFCGYNTYAQNEDDALRYSYTRFGGTARSVSMAGAFGALGSDFSVLSNNPGGMGLYKRSEMTFSPSLFSGIITSDYMGESNTDDKVSFNFGNAGVILADKRESGSNNWKSFALGFGYNRQKDFGYRMTAQGTNSQSSLLDQYVRDMSGKEPGAFDLFSTNLAWQTYLINPVDSLSTTYVGEMPLNEAKKQVKTYERRGGMGETVFSIGGNYNNKLFLGGTMGVSKIRYEEDATYAEEPVNDTLDLKAFSKTDYLSTNGSGINFKFGLIYMPVTYVRIGAAIHSPTFYYLTDEYSSGMTANFSNATYTYGTEGYDGGTLGSFRYRLKTPMRAIGSLAFVIQEYGLISADYEYVDYRESRLRAIGYTFSDANASINAKYRSTGNLRVGGEFRLDPFSLRAGYALYGSPFRDKTLASDQTYITGGVGYREKSFFIDLGFVTAKSKESFFLYDSAINPNPVSNRVKMWTFVTTVGFKL